MPDLREKVPNVRSGVSSAFSGLGSTGGWVRSQVSGTAANARELWDWFTLDATLPPSIVSTIQFFIETIPVALGVRGADSKRQFAASTTLIGVAILTSAITFGLTLVLVLFWGVFWLISVARLNPAFNDLWQRNTKRLPIKDDYDVWGWGRD